MRTLYIECNMGVAGDMLTAALLELHPQPQNFLKKLNEVGIEDVHTVVQKASKCGITGTQVKVFIHGEEEEPEDVHHKHAHEEHAHHHVHEEYTHHHGEQVHYHEHHHSSMQDITKQIAALKIEDVVKKDVVAVYQSIAEAESVVHDRPVTEIHFHEVGNKDALADIVAVCMLMHELSVEQVICSPVHVGYGTVQCAHGILPVPAPATAYLLRGIPTYGGSVQGELCTPTGAALLKHFANRFETQPVMVTEKIGYGLGKKDFAQANCVRVMLGETKENDSSVIELQCNLDDCTPENIAFAMERLFDEGALDVYTMPIGMKKNRSGILFTCMCKKEDKDKMLSLIFKHTTTLGVREYESKRYTLHREMVEKETPYGKVCVKKVTGYGVAREKAEYEDLAKIAREQGLSIEEIRKEL